MLLEQRDHLRESLQVRVDAHRALEELEREFQVAQLQMDLAGAVAAVRRARGRVATVAVEAMEFHRPVNIGDLVSCYAEVTRVGRSSMRVEIETWVERRMTRVQEKVTAGTFTYVAIDDKGRPRPVEGQAGE